MLKAIVVESVHAGTKIYLKNHCRLAYFTGGPTISDEVQILQYYFEVHGPGRTFLEGWGGSIIFVTYLH